MQRSKACLLLQPGLNSRNSGKNPSENSRRKADTFMGSCLTVYATLDRPGGKCGLIIFWEKNLIKKELELHTFLLCFNHEGIKAYTVKKIAAPHRQDWQNEMSGYVRIDFLEAVSLLQDAYRQNLRFGTRPASGLENYQFFLEYDTAGLEQEKLLNKLSFDDLTPFEFTNIYLAALNRVDHALLYDLSGLARRKRLGVREEFLCVYSENLADYTFLKSKVLQIAQQGHKKLITAYIILGTPQDEIMKISYQLELIEQGGKLYLDDMHELDRFILAGDHPENPLNYRVFCSVYAISCPKIIRNWLESNPDIFLTGEFDKGMCFKLLKAEEEPRNCFDITDRIISEFMLTEKEMIVYAPQPSNLARMEYLLTKEIKERVQFMQKYYLSVHELYKTVISGDSLEKLLQRSPQMTGFPSFKAASAFLFWRGKGRLEEFLRTAVTYKLLLEQDNWYFLSEKKKGENGEQDGFIEYYVAGNWLRINGYNTNLEKELKGLGAQAEIVAEEELEDYYDLFNPPLSVERKWKIYGMLNSMNRQAPTLKTMGMVPSVRRTARRLGALV